VHGGTGISGRAYLVGVKLFPPVHRGGDVHDCENLSEVLSVRLTSNIKLTHELEVVLSYEKLTKGTVAAILKAIGFSGTAIRPRPTVQWVSHTTDSVFKAPSLNVFYFNHRLFPPINLSRICSYRDL
jgi:hypothetical protein